MRFDFCIIGAGIVGLAVARKLQEARPGASIVLVEKEDGPARHQTGHNSGVIHAGIYYKPGSLKATLCRAGLRETKEFCTDNGIPYDECGKMIVATNDVEVERLQALYERATANGLTLEKIPGATLREIEPRITGKEGLLSPKTAIVDYKRVSARLAELIEQAGATIRYGHAVERIVEHPDHVEIGTSEKTWEASQLVVCGGLQADRLARMAGLKVDFRIVPFRGEYFKLPADKNDIVKHLIYPAPDPSMPFLGVHLTRMIDGSVTVGPNAVVGFAREGYKKFTINLRDMIDYGLYPGFWKVIASNVGHAMGELKGFLSKKAYLDGCRKYCPELELSDLLPYPAGVRAQAVNGKGEAVDDFLFAETSRMLHVCNAPSPAATSALPIGASIVAKLLGEDADIALTA